MAGIHPLALVDPAAELGESVVVGPFAVVEAGTRLGTGCVVGAGAQVRGGCVLGPGVRVESGAVLGGPPQDLKFDPATPSGVEIGEGTVIREYATVHRSTLPGGVTRIGRHCFLMAGAHVGHDCVVHDHAVLANNVLLAGHVDIGEHAFLGGAAVFHQFLRVGRGAMVSGGGRMSADIPPFVTAAERNGVFGLNLVGLRRRGTPAESLRELRAAYRAVYLQPGSPAKRAAALLPTAASAEAREFLGFFAGGRRKVFLRSRFQRDEE